MGQPLEIEDIEEAVKQLKQNKPMTIKEVEDSLKDLNLYDGWEDWPCPVIKCECGAESTPNPNMHADWCPKAGK